MLVVTEVPISRRGSPIRRGRVGRKAHRLRTRWRGYQTGRPSPACCTIRGALVRSAAGWSPTGPNRRGALTVDPAMCQTAAAKVWGGRIVRLGVLLVALGWAAFFCSGAIEFLRTGQAGSPAAL